MPDTRSGVHLTMEVRGSRHWVARTHPRARRGVVRLARGRAGRCTPRDSFHSSGALSRAWLRALLSAALTHVAQVT